MELKISKYYNDNVIIAHHVINFMSIFSFKWSKWIELHNKSKTLGL